MIIRQSPADTALGRALYPDQGWGLTELLLAGMADTLSWLQWSKTEDGRRNRNRPKRIPRPGIDDGSGEKMGNTPMSPAQMDEFLGYSMRG